MKLSALIKSVRGWLLVTECKYSIEAQPVMLTFPVFADSVMNFDTNEATKYVSLPFLVDSLICLNLNGTLKSNLASEMLRIQLYRHAHYMLKLVQEYTMVGQC